MLRYGKDYHLLVNLTWRCNNKCSYCWQVLMGREEWCPPFSKDEHTWEEWIKVLNALPPSTLDICGGEPTLFEGLFQLLDNIAEKHALALSTNLQTKKMFDCLSLLGAKRFVSITASWHKGSNSSPWLFLNRVKKLKQQGFPIHINIVNHPSYLLRIFQNDWRTLRLFKNHGIKVHISPFENPTAIIKISQQLICNAGVNTFMVTPSGDVYRCLTYFRSKWRSDAYLGNLFNDTFSPLHSEKLCNLRCEIYHVLDPYHTQKQMFSTQVEVVT